MSTTFVRANDVLRQGIGDEAEPMVSRRKILMLTHRVPFPPDRGDRIRSWNILLHLSKSYEVSLGCVSDEPLEADARLRLESVCKHFSVATIGSQTKWLRAGVSAARGRSLTEGLFWSPTLCRTLDRWAKTESFDAVLVYCSSMLRYARRKLLRDIPRFVDLVDVDSQKFYEYADNATAWKRAIYRTEGNRVRRLEQDAVQMSKAVTLVSDAEADVLCNTLEPAEHAVHGVANGVDTEYFAPADLPNDAASKTQSFPRLVFVGVMNYPPNVEALEWFVANVWPWLRESFPSASLDIVGKHPSASILQLSRKDGIRVTGSVPDVRPHISEADIVIAPLQIARGVQNKVLEAMSMGMPVIATSDAATGIDASSGQHLLIADSPTEWKSSIQQLSEDALLRQTLGRNARSLICEHYTWPATLAGLDRLLNHHLAVAK